jgi:hypothetical protein
VPPATQTRWIEPLIGTAGHNWAAKVGLRLQRGTVRISRISVAGTVRAVLAAEAINDLYRHELRLWDEPVSALGEAGEKVRVGSKVRRIYDAAQTPLERVLASAQAKPEQV